MKIGIDKIGFATSKYVLNIEDLAIKRGVNPNKYIKGLLQKEIAVSPIYEDVVTLGASACYNILDDENKSKIDMIIFATESSIDQSKAASIFVHGLLNIQPFCKCIEIKEACYGATAGLTIAKNHILQNPDSHVLLIASDIAKYGINTSGEPTQGVGSCAMIIKKDPNMLIINNESLSQTKDVMDFWRPNYSDVPIVDGHYSAKQYLELLEDTWIAFTKKTNKTLEDFNAFCFHLPFSKLGLKGLKSLINSNKNITKEHENLLLNNFNSSIIYNQKIGNIYTGSLYLSLLSLLENSEHIKHNDNIAMFSYGSGATCEIFSLTISENFKNKLQNNRLNYFNKRIFITVNEYENMFFENINLDENGNYSFNNNNYDFNPFILEKIENHKRIYKLNHLFKH